MVYAGGKHRVGEWAHYWKSLIIFSSVINWQVNKKRGKRRGRGYEPAMQAMTATLISFFARGHWRKSSASHLLNFMNCQKLNTGPQTNVKGLQAVWISYLADVLLVLEERRLLRWEFVRGHVWCEFVEIWRGSESVERDGSG